MNATPVKKWLIRLHRCLAIALCIPFLVWFGSGIAMIYAGGMPRLTAAERLRRLDAIDVAQVRLSPFEAQVAAQSHGEVERVILLTIMGRPAYRLWALAPTTVFADTGELLGAVDAKVALVVAASFLNIPRERLHYGRELLGPDQWTIGLGPEFPLHRIEVDDERGTEVYVSETLGEVVMLTDRGSRALAWLAAIPHWLYVTPLRARDRIWRQVVLWMSALGTVVALAGLLLAVVQSRVRYVGLMRWHYRAGVAFGAFALTWTFSGWLSMQPWGWASPSDIGARVALALSGGLLDLKQFPTFNGDAWTRFLNGNAAKEIELLQAHGKPYYVVHQTVSPPLIVSARAFEGRQPPFPASLIVARLTDAFRDVPVADSQVLSRYDSFYRDRDRQAPLPVVRIRFSDADRTWVYVDLATSAVVAHFTRRQRLERWMYHGLHSLDFAFWYEKRPLWDAVLIVLCSGGLALSAIGTIMGWRRLGKLRR